MPLRLPEKSITFGTLFAAAIGSRRSHSATTRSWFSTRFMPSPIEVGPLPSEQTIPCLSGVAQSFSSRRSIAEMPIALHWTQNASSGPPKHHLLTEWLMLPLRVAEAAGAADWVAAACARLPARGIEAAAVTDEARKSRRCMERNLAQNRLDAP